MIASTLFSSSVRSKQARAHVLEYWMDCSRFSKWRRPAVRLPFRVDVLRADVAFYSSLGIRSLTSFGVMLDQDYVREYGQPPVLEYSPALQGL